MPSPSAPRPSAYDLAYAAMEAEPQNDALRLALYDRLADSELFVILEEEPEGEDIRPQVFTTEEGDFVLAFDSEERLAEFVGEAAPYAALPGRVIAQSLAGEGLGLGVNLDVAPSAMLLPPEAMEWLAETLEATPEAGEAEIARFTAPALPPAILAALLPALEAKFSTIRGLASHALLAGVEYVGGGRGHVLAILGAHEAAEAGLAKAVQEALMFSGLEAGQLDVMFIAPEDAGADALLAQALVLVVPEPEQAPEVQVLEHKAPGMDPSKPPILR